MRSDNYTEDTWPSGFQQITEGHNFQTMMRSTAIKLGVAAAYGAVLYIMASLTTPQLHSSSSSRPSPVVAYDVVQTSEPGTSTTAMMISRDDAPKDAEQATELAPPEDITGHSNIARFGSEEVGDKTDERSHSMPTKEVRCVKLKGPPKYDPALECRKRLPRVIGIGLEKCGSGAMTFFLRMHPYVAHSVPKELYYYNRHANESLGWYRDRMPVSSKHQVTMEFTPSYIFGRDVPALIKKRATATKFILMLRDPVVRAVSHFLHLQHCCKKSGKVVNRPLKPGKPARAFLNDTFETTVVGGDGKVLEGNSIVENGLYDVHLQRWLDVFPRDRFLVVDEGEFSKDPIPSLRRVEEFLDLPPFFNQDLIYFDEKRGLFCKTLPKQSCLGKTKGRTHPDVRDDVLQKLTDFYRPHNLRINSLLNRNFSWTYEK